MFLWSFWYADGRLVDMWKGAASSFWAVGLSFIDECLLRL
jgi:hypothetical protein